MDGRSERVHIIRHGLQLLAEIPSAIGNKREEDRIERQAYAQIDRLTELQRGDA